MITIVLTNRNREIRIVKNCLDSLQLQSDVDFELFLVDYGSHEKYLKELKVLGTNYPKIKFIFCPTIGQLWSKCRAINIALKQTTQPYFVVGDIDLIFHPNYIAILKKIAQPDKVYYFQYGFLSESESLKSQEFSSFLVDFKGDEKVTGNTLFPTASLQKVNGFDEFYQGWGAEDTDAQIRMKNLGLEVVFYDREILVKHQWHPKVYRSKDSTHPYHSNLERINHAYMVQTETTKRTLVNQEYEWGKLTNGKEYKKLMYPTVNLKTDNSLLKFRALLAQLDNCKNDIIRIEINKVSVKELYKNKIYKILRKKYFIYIEMEELNNIILEELIKNYRNCPYNYSFSRQTNKIELTINFTK